MASASSDNTDTSDVLYPSFSTFSFSKLYSNPTTAISSVYINSGDTRESPVAISPWLPAPFGISLPEAEDTTGKSRGSGGLTVAVRDPKFFRHLREGDDFFVGAIVGNSAEWKIGRSKNGEFRTLSEETVREKYYEQVSTPDVEDRSPLTKFKIRWDARWSEPRLTEPDPAGETRFLFVLDGSNRGTTRLPLTRTTVDADGMEREEIVTNDEGQPIMRFVGPSDIKKWYDVKIQYRYKSIWMTSKAIGVRREAMFVLIRPRDARLSISGPPQNRLTIGGAALVEEDVDMDAGLALVGRLHAADNAEVKEDDAGDAIDAEMED